MKRLLIAVCMALMLFGLCVVANAEDGASGAVVTEKPTRVINLVYDDSGSMIANGGVATDRWCQAKYAMEIFASMLGEKDTLNIYYMSQFEYDYADDRMLIQGEYDNIQPNFRLAGTDGAETNVEIIHKAANTDGATPFSCVAKAAKDLSAIEDNNVDEKWLVILTDGLFGIIPDSVSYDYEYKNNKAKAMNTNDIIEKLKEYAEVDKTSVLMLVMEDDSYDDCFDGKDEVAYGDSLYLQKVDSSANIPESVTKLCNKIFQSDELPMTRKAVSFEFPVSQLIVVAQGAGANNDIKINGKNPSSVVKIQYSKEDGRLHDETLNGYVATFDYDFQPGTYKIDADGADIQVYFKPNVKIAAYLYDADSGVEVAKDSIIAGDYRVEWGFVYGNDEQKRISEKGSEILNATFTPVIKNNGKEIEIKDGIITLESRANGKDGDLDIEVTANYLKYNETKATMKFDVFEGGDLIFKVNKNPVYKLNTEGFENDDKPIEVNVKIKMGEETENELSEEQWNLLLLENIHVIHDAKVGAFRIEKGDYNKPEEKGKLFIYPTLYNEDPYETAIDEEDDKSEYRFDITITGRIAAEKNSASGSLVEEVVIKNSITTTQRIMKWLEENGVKLAVSLIIFFLVLGYMPFVKKYFPKKLKKRPLIECRAAKIGLKDTQSHGSYRKNNITTFIPYKAETGTLTFSPSPHKKSAKIKAAGKGGMYITNMKNFAGKQEIQFNGVPFPEGQLKPRRISCTSTITMKTPEYTYNC